MIELISSHCQSAGSLAERLGLPEHVSRGLTYTFERWDGSGLPSGAKGEKIPLGMRIVHLADVAEGTYAPAASMRQLRWPDSAAVHSSTRPWWTSSVNVLGADAGVR